MSSELHPGHQQDLPAGLGGAFFATLLKCHNGRAGGQRYTQSCTVRHCGEGDQAGAGWEVCLPSSKHGCAKSPDWVRALQSCTARAAFRIINPTLQHFYW